MISKKYLAVVNCLEDLGAELMKGFGNTSIIIKHKGESIYSVVTKYDFYAEEFIYETLKKKFPEIGFKGEELGIRNAKDSFWLVDPIDGTVFYTHGIPYSTTLLSLIQEGKVIFSATYNFATKEMYVAEKNKGSFKNNKKIYVSKRPFKDSFIFMESTLKVKKDLDLFLRLRRSGQQLDAVVSGYEFCKIADGTFDGRIVTNSLCKDWDVAAGVLLVQEAGGEAFNINSKSYDYTNLNFVVGNKNVVKELTSGAYFK